MKPLAAKSLKDGYYAEVWPLLGGRARIILMERQGSMFLIDGW